MTSSLLFTVSILAFLAVNGARAQVPGYLPECPAPVSGLLNGGSNPQCSPVPVPTLVPTRPSKKVHIPWNKCNKVHDSKVIILGAADHAKDLVTEALNGLRQLNTSRVAMEIYTKWFGVFDERRFGIAQEIFERLNSNNFTSYTYVCSCDECGAEDVSACAWKDIPDVVHLCQFWGATLDGTSRAGIIVHEATHFTKNGGTLDIGDYGPEACHGLAKAQPDEAVRNADSYEWFAEDYWRTLHNVSGPQILV
ncbi:zincin [Pluteus cervinus]|uniref:Zincin n=1 Tax=Pluteus cervinus TaxID=181527 RepID=A0ACD3AHW4_9AGAR|nr:zincin [Pluteus cervinus]